MKKVLGLLLPVVMVCAFATPVAAYVPKTADLVVGRDASLDVGDVALVCEDGTLKVFVGVDYRNEGGWSLEEARVYVGVEPPEKSAPGQLELAGEVTEDGEIVENHCALEIELPEEAIEAGEVCIAVHVQLQREAIIGYDAGGCPIYGCEEETAWAQVGGCDSDLVDIPIGKGKNWATYFIYEISDGERD